MKKSKGYCQCGCGQKTSIIRETCRRKGLIKGEPRRFVLGHNTKTKKRKKPRTLTVRQFKRQRQKLFSTQVTAAQALGVTPQAVSNWELGHRPVPLSIAIKMADLLLLIKQKHRPVIL